MPRKMTDKGVAKLKPKKKGNELKRRAVPDPELRGHWIRVQPSGSKSFWTVARDPNQKQIWTYVGPSDAMTIEAAREKAREFLTRVRAGLPAIEPKAESFGGVIDTWFRREVEGKKRSRDKIDYLLGRHISPELRAREFTTIRRDDVTALLDKIEDEHSPHQADKVFTIVRSIANWYASRHSDYNSPLVKGMTRAKGKGNGRDRKLDDDEIRAVWAAASDDKATGVLKIFDALVKMLLLTMQRLDKVVTMRWDDIDADGVWTVPIEPGEKENIGRVQLPKVARAIIAALPRFANNPYVFAGRGGQPISKSGNHMAAFRRRLPKDVERFTQHDLRRTARSLLPRAGVSDEHAERVMGHVIGGVKGIYNRYEYEREKSEALARLANLIDNIVHPRENIVPMKKGERVRSRKS